MQASPPPDEAARRFFARGRVAVEPVEIDPTLPGHSVSGSGYNIGVERTLILPGGTQISTDVVITPDVSAAVAPAWSDAYNRIGQGFTEEELIFRAKWGWAAHDAALRLAFATANGGATADVP